MVKAGLCKSLIHRFKSDQDFKKKSLAKSCYTEKKFISLDIQSNKEMKELILLRGLPGSGKSTFADFLSDFYQYIGISRHLEADMYHIINGEYNWKAEDVKAAHKWCQYETEEWMKWAEKHRDDLIIVSNTFTQEWEMKPYYELAEKYRYRVYSLIVENRHEGLNIHNVPEEVLNKMEKRFEIKLK